MISFFKMAVELRDVTVKDRYRLADLIRPDVVQQFVVDYLDIRHTEYK